MFKKSNTQAAEKVETMQAVETRTIPTNDKGQFNQVILTDEQVEAYNKMSTKSEKIRYLTAMNFSRSAIAKFMGILYQHVREVQLRPLKRGPRQG